MAIQIYGVVRSDRPDPRDPVGTGAAGRPVRLVRSGPVAAVVGDHPAGIEATDAEQYLDVLTALLAGGPVFPVRFGTVAPDEDAVRGEVLDPHASELARRLDALDGLVEVRLEVTASEEDELRRLLASSPGLRELVGRSRDSGGSVSARIGLGEEISIGLRERRAAREEQITRLLRPLAVAGRPVSGEDVTATVLVFLVEASRLGEFDDAVDRLRSGLGEEYAVEYAGPLPPFDFLDHGVPEGAGTAEPDRHGEHSGPFERRPATTGDAWTPAARSGRWGW